MLSVMRRKSNLIFIEYAPEHSFYYLSIIYESVAINYYMCLPVLLQGTNISPAYLNVSWRENSLHPRISIALFIKTLSVSSKWINFYHSWGNSALHKYCALNRTWIDKRPELSISGFSLHKHVILWYCDIIYWMQFGCEDNTYGLFEFTCICCIYWMNLQEQLSTTNWNYKGVENNTELETV